jgi:PAS domain S-box-containing protein
MADASEPMPSYDELRDRLDLAEQTLDAIHHGEVDALMISTPMGPRVYTLQGADEFYRAFVEQMSEGAAAVQPDGTILFANQALANLVRMPLGSLVGHNLTALVADADSARLADLLAARGEIGEAAVTLTRAQHLDDEVPVWLYAREVRTHTGEPTLCLLVVDQSQRLEAEHARHAAELAELAQAASARRVFLAELTEELAGMTDPDAAMRRLAQRVVPWLADWSMVTVAEEDGNLRTVGWAHRDPAYEPAVAEYALGRTPVLGAADSPAAVSVELREDSANGGEDAEIDRHLRPHGVVALPLTGRGRTFGELTLVTTSERGEHTELEKALALDVALRAGPALDAARVTQRSRTLAESMQRSLLTTTTPAANLTVATRYRPAHVDREVGGDWYDTFGLPGGSTVVSIGDVMGHDLAAMAAMAQLRTMMRASAWSLRHSPAEVLTATDHASFGLGSEIFATAVTAEIEAPAPDGSVLLKWSNAGHVPPVLLLPDGSATLLADEPANIPLGVEMSTRRDDHSVTLSTGSILLLYTDGLVERRGRDIDEGLDDLLAFVTGRQSDSLGAILDDLLAEVAETDLRDDVALLAVRVGGAVSNGDVRETLVRLPADRTAPSVGRNHIAMVTAGLPEDVQDNAELLASELITNAIVFKIAPITLRTRVSSDVVEVAVHDYGPGRPKSPEGPPDPTALNGRGLVIVAALSDSWGTTVDESGSGKSVWFRLRLSD